MNLWISLVPAIAALLTAIGALAAVFLNARQDRKKPALDQSNAEVSKATLQKMVDDRSYYRDVRMLQLEGYVDLDREWHRNVITQFRGLLDLLRRLQSEGLIPPDVQIPGEPPVPPPIPDPPHRG